MIEGLFIPIGLDCKWNAQKRNPVNAKGKYKKIWTKLKLLFDYGNRIIKKIKKQKKNKMKWNEKLLLIYFLNCCTICLSLLPQ